MSRVILPSQQKIVYVIHDLKRAKYFRARSKIAQFKTYQDALRFMSTYGLSDDEYKVTYLYIPNYAIKKIDYWVQK